MEGEKKKFKEKLHIQNAKLCSVEKSERLERVTWKLK